MRIRIAAITLACILAVPAASGYELLNGTWFYDSTGSVTGYSCTGNNHYPAPGSVSFEVNLANMTGLFDMLQFDTAVRNISDAISSVGGQDLRMSVSGTSSAAFAYDNINGINEIGLADLSLFGSPRGTTLVVVNPFNCDILETDVYLNEDLDWAFNTPGFYAEDYYNDIDSEAPGPIFNQPLYGRPTILHELGHALGLDHTDSSYSMMNYGVFGWANAPVGEQMAPLADDREGMRFLYGNDGTETDLALLNTYYLPQYTSSSGAAEQSMLCYPTGGDRFRDEDWGLGACGELANGDAGPRAFCPGDTIYVRYAMTNYGTTMLDGKEQLWFSTDEELDTSVDLRSDTRYAFTANPQSSYRKTRTYEVPSAGLQGGEFYVIARANTQAQLASEESEDNNWIPLPYSGDDPPTVTILGSLSPNCVTITEQTRPILP